MSDQREEQTGMQGSALPPCYARSEVIAIVMSEPEFPEPCPQLRGYIADAVKNGDTEWIVHMLRQTVRQTKLSIADKFEA